MQNIKQWYLDNFPEDELGQTLRDDITFEDLFEALDNYQDVYVFLFGDPMGGDSVIRERIFEELAEIMEVPYEEVYDQWLQASESNVMSDRMGPADDFEVEGNAYDHRDEENMTLVESVLEKLYDASALTFEGFDLSALNEAFEFFVEQDLNAEAHIISGAQMNDICSLTGSVAYPEDLNIVSFFNTGNVIAIQVGARWMDDIIDNNAYEVDFHPFDPTFDQPMYDDDYAEIDQDFDDLEDMFESYVLEEGVLTEDSRQEKVREAVALIQQLPEEQEQEALNMLKELDNMVLDSPMLEPTFVVLNAEEDTEKRDQIFSKHLLPNVRKRLLQASILILDKPDFDGFTILKALETLKGNQRVIDKVAEIAGEDFEAETNEKLVFDLNEAHQGTGMDRIGIHETIYDAFMAEGFPFVSEDKVNNVIGRVRYRVKKEVNSKYEIVDIDLGEVGYARLSREVKERIERIIREEVKEEVDRLKGKRPGTPTKFAKHRGGFPGTAKKTK